MFLAKINDFLHWLLSLRKPINLVNTAELLHRSSGRILRLIADQRRNGTWSTIMKREAWIHLKRSFEVWWHLRRGKQ